MYASTEMVSLEYTYSFSSAKLTRSSITSLERGRLLNSPRVIIKCWVRTVLKTVDQAGYQGDE